MVTSQQPFEGVIGKSFADSKPWWPPLDRAPEGSPNVPSRLRVAVLRIAFNAPFAAELQRVAAFVHADVIQQLDGLRTADGAGRGDRVLKARDDEVGRCTAAWRIRNGNTGQPWRNTATALCTFLRAVSLPCLRSTHTSWPKAQLPSKSRSRD